LDEKNSMQVRILVAPLHAAGKESHGGDEKERTLFNGCGGKPPL
jgi:hypothetical protein